MTNELIPCPSCSELLTSRGYCFTCRKFRQKKISAESGYLPPYERKQSFSETRSFFADLFNYKFENFIFIRVARAFYLWTLIISALALVYYELSLLTNFFNGLNEANNYGEGSYYIQSNFWLFIGLLIALPLGYLFEVIILRLILEAGVALIKIAENTARDE
jgi:hypothetical protein